MLFLFILEWHTQIDEWKCDILHFSMVGICVGCFQLTLCISPVHCSLDIVVLFLHYNNFNYVTITKFQTLQIPSPIHSIFGNEQCNLIANNTIFKFSCTFCGMHSAQQNGLDKLIQIIHLYTFVVVCIYTLHNIHSHKLFSVSKKKDRRKNKIK